MCFVLHSINQLKKSNYQVPIKRQGLPAGVAIFCLSLDIFDMRHNFIKI